MIGGGCCYCQASEKIATEDVPGPAWSGGSWGLIIRGGWDIAGHLGTFVVTPKKMVWPGGVDL
jgi:hypothetical protein